MESRFRYRFFGPKNILDGVDNLVGQVVLEVGAALGTLLFRPRGGLVIADVWWRWMYCQSLLRL